MANAPYPRHTLLINDIDYTDYLIPDSLVLSTQAQNGVSSFLEYVIKQVPGSFEVEGGQRVDLYFTGSSAPIFSGFQTRTESQRYAPSTWRYGCRASGYESIFSRRQLFTSLRSVSYAGAVNQILASDDQSFPSSLIQTVSDPGGILTDAMPFFAINGAFPSEIFNLICNLTGAIWRVISVGTSYQLEFVDPFSTFSGFELNQTNQSFRWNSFRPSVSLDSVINSQSVRGAQTATDTEDTVYFRGDGLSSRFNLPTKPFNNQASVILFDSFNSAPINSGIWFESDIVGDYVYADDEGFIQITSGANSWVGLISTPLAARSSFAMTTIDINWVTDGIAMFGFTALNAVPSDPIEFIEAGIYIDASGNVFGVSNGSTVGQSSVVLDESEQYRFRIQLKETGCIVEYQSSGELYTRDWTPIFESNDGTAPALATACMSYSAGISLAMVKTVSPYLGVKLEVDRGTGFVQEEVGVYPIDEDVDAVIMEESTLAFFGSDPGPSTVPPEPTWNADSNYKNIRVTYRRGVNIFATYRNSQSISDVAGLFGGSDDGVREGPVIVDDSITSYEAAIARAKSEVVNRSNIVERITAQTSVNILADASVSIPSAGDSARFSITLPTTGYTISDDLPIRKVRYSGMTGLNDIQVVVEAGALNRGLKTVLSELSASGKLISINENQIIYSGRTVLEPVSIVESVSSFGAGATRVWGDSRLSKTVTVNTSTDIVTSASASLFVTADAVRFETTGTLPSPLSANSVYYINRQSATTFYVYDTSAHAISGGATGRVNLTTTGSGIHTVLMNGWQYANHRWNSFKKDAEIRVFSTLTATAKKFKRVHFQEEAVLNINARII